MTSSPAYVYTGARCSRQRTWAEKGFSQCFHCMSTGSAVRQRSFAPAAVALEGASPRSCSAHVRLARTWGTRIDLFGNTIRSGFLRDPSTSGPIRPTRRHSAIALLCRLIRPAFAVRCRLGEPRLVPCFPCAFFLNMSPSATPGSPAVVYTPVPSAPTLAFSPFSTDSALPSFPQIRFTRGHLSELHYGSLALQPADLFTLLTDRTGFTPSPRGFLLPGFRRVGHPPRRRLLLRWQLGNFHRRDLHPQEWQLASLHTKVVP